MQVSTAIDLVLTRLRDPNATAHSRAFVMNLLSEAQRLVNAASGSVVASSALATEAQRQLYLITSSLPSVVRVLGVREGPRDLEQLDWRVLYQAFPRWHRAIGSRFEVFCLIGRDLLVVHPAKTEASSVDVIYVKLTTAFALETDLFEIPDDLIPLAIDLTEAVLLLKNRSLVAAAVVGDRIAEKLGLKK